MKDIGKVIRREKGDDGNPSREEIEKQKQETEEKEKQDRWKSISIYSKAFQMFKDRRPLADVAIELDIESNVVLNFFSDYLMLTKMDILVKIYKELGQDFPLFIPLYKRAKEEGLNKEEITEILQNKNKLKDICYELGFYHTRISELKDTKSALEQEVNSLKRRRDNYDGITPV